MTARPDHLRPALLLGLRRASRWPALLAVLAFGLRALVPTGFMLMPVDGHLQWTLCPDAVAAVGNPAAHAHFHHDGMAPAMADHAAHAAGVPAAGHESQAHCPFALAAAAPLAGLPPALVAPRFEPQLLPAIASQPGRAADAPYRHAAARGPPTLA